MRASGEWYRKRHRGALAHRLHAWLEGINGSAMETDCGKEVRDTVPLLPMDPPTTKLERPGLHGAGRPTGYCRRCSAGIG